MLDDSLWGRLQKMVRMVNEMRADLVLLTGDLINDALADLDTGLELARALEARFGLAIIEGNHDLIENPAEFERRVRASGVPFLLDESTVVDVTDFRFSFSDSVGHGSRSRTRRGDRGCVKKLT